MHSRKWGNLKKACPGGKMSKSSGTKGIFSFFNGLAKISTSRPSITKSWFEVTPSPQFHIVHIMKLAKFGIHFKNLGAVEEYYDRPLVLIIHHRYMHQRSQNLCRLDPDMGLNLGVFGFVFALALRPTIGLIILVFKLPIYRQSLHVFQTFSMFSVCDRKL